MTVGILERRIAVAMLTASSAAEVLADRSPVVVEQPPAWEDHTAHLA